MAGMMNFAAGTSLYTSTNTYWTSPLLAVLPPPPGPAEWCGYLARRYRDVQIENRIKVCEANPACYAACASDPMSPLCEGCVSGLNDCIKQAREAYAGFGNCPVGSTCRADFGYDPSTIGYSRCCDGDLVP